MPKISIIVPIYNVEKYLCRCIDSILGQIFEDFEVILVDDESPDAGGIICDEYAKRDTRIKVIHQKNGGVSCARNTGLDCASGEYVAFCDSDDYLHSGYLERLLDAAQKYDADRVSANYVVLTEQRAVLSESKLKKEFVSIDNRKRRLNDLLCNVVGNTAGWSIWNKLYRNDIIRKHHIRFCTSCGNYAEDLGFDFEYALYAQRSVSIEDKLYYYVMRDGSMMNGSEYKIKLNEINELLRYLEKKYIAVLSGNKEKRHFALLCFLIMYRSEYRKLVDTERYALLGEEIKKIKNLSWYRKQLRNLFLCRRELTEIYGNRNAKRILLFSWYCLHGNWNRYRYESAIAYKFFIKEEKK